MFPVRRIRLLKYSGLVHRQLFKRTFRTPSPFDNNQPADLNEAVRQTLENDPNLAGFFDDSTLASVQQQEKPENNTEVEDDHDPFDFSSMPLLKDEDDQLLQQMNFRNEPVTIPTSQLMKKNSVTSRISPAQIAVEEKVVAGSSVTDVIKEVPESFNDLNFHKYLHFINNGDMYQDFSAPNNISLDDITMSPHPLSVISKFTDPKLNLSIEKYLYENMPDPRKEPLARRLVLYKNRPCIVMGKNQNPFKEINLKLAGMYEIPILRRMSGGGTVVHDLGNVNFSFIASKDEFHRAKFSGLLVDKLNDLVGVNGEELNDLELPSFKLKINAKGDIINFHNEKKISGSAYQISKGKSLHHGTMLLNSNLKILGRLLKLSDRRKKSIICKSIDSIPSPVENMGVDEDIFKYCCVNAFIEGYGEQVSSLFEDYDNLIKINGSDVMKVDKYQDLPKEVWDNYETFNDWNWTFGKTPKFEFKLVDEANGYFDVRFVIDKGLVIKEVVIEDDINGVFSKLADAVEDGVRVPFVGECVREYIEDSQVGQVVSWNIDFDTNYQRVHDGVDRMVSSV